jgi:hypothetical protein
MADWSRHFDEPIPLPEGGELRTLLDAGRYADALPRIMHEHEEWQMAMEVLLLAVEGREPVSLLRIALTLALRESSPTRGPLALMSGEAALHAVPRLYYSYLIIIVVGISRRHRVARDEAPVDQPSGKVLGDAPGHVGLLFVRERMLARAALVLASIRDATRRRSGWSIGRHQLRQ